MNQKRRERIARAVSYLETAYNILNGVLDEEQDAMNNMPENLQESDQYIRMEEASFCVEDMMDSVWTALDVCRNYEKNI